MIQQKSAFTFNGYLSAVVILGLQIGLVAFFISVIRTAVLADQAPQFIHLILCVLAFILVTLCWFGLFNVAPNQGKILQLFGKYKGTEHNAGLRWANPLFTNTPISIKIRNFESSKMKVNDASGSPIEIAAVVVWRVVDSAEAFFEVDDFESFVTIQSESALRNLANQYPYESNEASQLSLRSDPLEVADKLKEEIQARLNKAGVEVIEARISHLAYSTEIAQAMLRKQQAGAVLAARRIIVQGAVEMVTDAIDTLTRDHDFELDDERKASMVSNLLVVICSEQQTHPVVNAGSIY
ncbi:SPFH domain-containing protein [Arenicella xantha]|uniref:SPFH domain/Band 7 family protein n=1 Tax=Arenicella xantha TaxID=644221 RepID=A0A395JKH9_9GAMM|nr:SPFH domain-containing protein [Arenicella xantha]RBP51293.1 SPFH domain/Band 7 family protein [Arenicella xantha]